MSVASRRRRIARRWLGACPLAGIGLVVSLGLAGCGSSSVPRAAPSPSGAIDVVADASLRTVFERLGHRFETLHPATSIRFRFASDLGSVGPDPATDVRATSGPSVVSMPSQRRAVAYTSPFAQDRLVLIASPSVPSVRGLTDLRDPGVRVALARSSLPVGSDARRVLQLAGVWTRVSSRVVLVPDGAAVISAVSSGVADAGIVERSGVPLSSELRTVAIPGFDNVTETYTVTAYKGASAPLATAFARYLATASAQALLIRHGFMASPCDCHG